VWANNDDRTILKKLYEEFNRNPRLILMEDHTAPELKYIVSQCRLFVGARTHATIAAYSRCVPTLVVGYSVMARGIASDLFGTEEGYVLPVQSLKEPMELTNAFQEMADREEEIRAHLNQMLPNYCACAKAAVQAVRALEKAL
jgi:polysaccharide pyruvyl transferase WcaK-like protein